MRAPKRTPPGHRLTPEDVAAIMKLAAYRLSEDADRIARDRVKLHECGRLFAAVVRGEMDLDEFKRRGSEIFPVTSAGHEEVA